MKLYRLVEQPVCFWWWFVSWMDAVPMVTEFWDVAFIYELLVRQLERCRFIRWSQCPIISTLVQRCFITFVSDVMSEFIVFNVWQCRSWRSSSVVSQHWFSSSYLLSLLVLVVTSHSLSAVAVTHFGAEFRLCFCLVSKLLVFYSNFFMLFFHDHHHDHRQPWARWCLTPLLLSLPTAAYLGQRGLTSAGLPHTTAQCHLSILGVAVLFCFFLWFYIFINGCVWWCLCDMDEGHHSEFSDKCCFWFAQTRSRTCRIRTSVAWTYRSRKYVKPWSCHWLTLSCTNRSALTRLVASSCLVRPAVAKPC